MHVHMPTPHTHTHTTHTHTCTHTHTHAFLGENFTLFSVILSTELQPPALTILSIYCMNCISVTHLAAIQYGCLGVLIRLTLTLVLLKHKMYIATYMSPAKMHAAGPTLDL